MNNNVNSFCTFLRRRDFSLRPIPFLNRIRSGVLFVETVPQKVLKGTPVSMSTIEKSSVPSIVYGVLVFVE